MRKNPAWIVFMLICLVFSCLSVTVQAKETVDINVGQTLSFSATENNHIAYYSFTPEADGRYVLYSSNDGAWLSVHGCQPSDGAFDGSVLARGMNQVIFSAQAGVTCWLKVESAWSGGQEMTDAVTLATPAAAEGIQIGYASLTSQFVGGEGKLFLQYTPVGSAAQISWETSDAEVVSVEGDDNGAVFRLVGAGAATITAKTAEGLTAQYQVEAPELLELPVGGSCSVTMEPSDGEYVTEKKYIQFTPLVSGSYVLSVGYDENLDLWHGLNMSMTGGTGYPHGSKSMYVDGVAGQTSTVCVELWGMYDQPVEYTFSLDSGVLPSALALQTNGTIGYVGSSVHVAVQWLPDNSLSQDIQWTVSDEAVAKIASGDNDGAQLQLLAPGTVTLTATTAEGLSDSLEITVCQHPGTIELVAGANPSLQMLPNDYFDCAFTPATTGYYRMNTNQKQMTVQLDAKTVVRNGEKLYHLEAGKSYTGGIDNLSDAITTGVITVTLVETPAPVAIQITKLPEQTEFSPGVLDEIWVYDLLEGMEMEVRWSDGHTSVWALDADGMTFENYEVRWELRKIDANNVNLVMKLGEASAVCQLTVKDLTAIRMELLDADTIQIVENSCGYFDEPSKAWIYAEYLLWQQSFRITFDDGSTVTAKVNQTVLGKRLLCQHEQYEQPWVKGGSNTVTFSYGKLSLHIPVDIVESPVRRIQFHTKPRDTFDIGDRKFFTADGDGGWYFSGKKLKAYLEGMSFKIFYLDDTYKIVNWEDIQWRKVTGVEYPFVDGYPLGLPAELLRGEVAVSGPVSRQTWIEYMGSTVTYEIQLVEPEEDIPQTHDSDIVAYTVLCMGAMMLLALSLMKKKW